MCSQVVIKLAYEKTITRTVYNILFEVTLLMDLLTFADVNSFFFLPSVCCLLTSQHALS